MYQTIKRLLEESLQLENITLEIPKNKDFGHYATPIAFTLAKTYKKAPHLIAQEIVERIKKIEIFHEVQAVGGYINLRLTSKFLDAMADKMLYHQEVSKKNKKILLEYVSANPTGPLHIGHARGAIFGDSFSRIGRYLGYHIQTEYYINDAGSQIEMLGISVMLAGREHLLKLPVDYPKEYYKGEYIIEIAKLAQQKYGDHIFSEESLSLLNSFSKDLMLEEIKNNLKEIGIVFDSFVSEKSLYSDWKTVFSRLENRKAVYKKDDKVWLKSQAFGDEKDRVIVRDNEVPTYFAGDIIYHHHKFMRHYDHYINIWGADHHGYINRICASLEHLGHDSKKLEIILAQMVGLLKDGKPYKMSKRAGNFILMKDVVADIGSDALRFVFLSKKLDTTLEFDVSTLEKRDSSNPIFYINYANARIHTLFEKCNKNYDFSKISLENLQNRDALDLLFEALYFQKVIENAFDERALQKICEYLRNLAASFHSFYNHYRILETQDEAELFKIFSVISRVFTLGFKLLGIEIKTKM